jgi:tetratricopeptide (TPR) repeat protein
MIDKMKRKNLIAAREKYFKSQQALADALPVSRQELSDWERCIRTPQSHYRQRLKEELHCNDLEELLQIFEDVGPPGQSSPLDEDDLMEETTRYISVPSTITTFITSTLNIQLLHIAHTDYSTPDDMTTAIQCALKDFTQMNPNDEITRRTALIELASLPMIALGRNQTLSSRRHEETLRHCTAALEACWQLYRSSDPVGPQHAFDCCCTYVPLLESIAHDSSQCRDRALNLAAQYALVQTMLGWKCIGARESTSHAQHALYLSRENGNILLQVSAHCKLSWTCTQGGDYIEAHNTMREGESLLKRYQRTKKQVPLPDGIVGNFYSSYALAQVHTGIEPDAALGIALDSELMPGRIGTVKFTITDQWWEAARICSAKGDPKQAMIWLEKLIDINTFATQGQLTEGGRIGAINTLTDALLQAENRDMKHIIRAWTAAIKGAKALKSEQRYRDAMTNFAAMWSRWRREDAIKRLIPLTAHW